MSDIEKAAEVVSPLELCDAAEGRGSHLFAAELNTPSLGD
jgi:hypothetical protein